MIDEFQDIDEPQYKLMKVLCDYHKNLFIVGDPDQTIYTWRGASVNYLLNFDKEFPDVHTIMMNRNYRSTPQIISVANSLIANNSNRIKKDLIPTLPNGRKVICHHGATSEEEAKWIAGQIKAMNSQGTPYRDITILYRAHHVTRSIEEVFLKEKIPYTIYSGVQFFARMEIKDALCYLRMIAYKDDLSFLRIVNVPKRNIGERRINFLKEYALQNNCSLYEAMRINLENDIFRGTGAVNFIQLIEMFSAIYQNHPVSEIIAAVLDESGYEKMLRTEGSQERLDNLAELKQSVYEYETSCGEECTLEHYLTHVALFTNTDAAESGDKVRLMTVHSAKGLEFENVFLCAMNEGVFPSGKTRTIQAMEEERRLGFVAVTRARNLLCLSEAEGRNFDGSPRYPSRFILDIDQSLLEYTEEPREVLISEARSYIQYINSRLTTENKSDCLPIGQKINHMIFGNGEITDIDMDKGAYLIKFDELDTPRSIAFRVKLDKIQTP